jgi:NADH dehydrogenase/NADH:ubiquinone oxidoreductase subunit G
MPDITVDGEGVEVGAGATILDACRASGRDIPTLCYGPTLTPKNACRVCMVELEGSRVLVPSCSRVADDGMVVRTDTERTRHARKMVLEFLASSVDLSIAPNVDRWMAQYGADAGRYGPTAETVAQPVKVDNELYVRDYARCILCYKCVDACGEQWQNTFAIGVAGRGFDAHISTEWEVPLRRVAVQLGVPAAGGQRVAARRPDRDDDGLPLLRGGLQPHPARAGQPDRQGHEPR